MKQDIYIPLHTADKEPIDPDAITFPVCTDEKTTIGSIKIYDNEGNLMHSHTEGSTNIPIKVTWV